MVDQMQSHHGLHIGYWRDTLLVPDSFRAQPAKKLFTRYTLSS